MLVLTADYLSCPHMGPELFTNVTSDKAKKKSKQNKEKREKREKRKRNELTRFMLKVYSVTLCYSNICL